MLNPLNHIALGAIWGYKLLLSPIFGRTCRFLPTCSDYAAECYKNFGFLQASGLVWRRILKCQPWGSSGVDFPPPAPEKKVKTTLKKNKEVN